MGFIWRYNLYGSPHPVIAEFFAQGTETLTKGDIMNVESGEVDLAVTTDALLAGVLIGAVDPDDNVDGQPGVIAAVDSTTRLRVQINPDAVYGIEDDNARDAGATLDITGATGAQTIAASSNTEFVVVKTKKANSDETQVMITPAAHYIAKL